MSARRVWIVGAGKRVRETALPALASLPEHFELAGVFGRSARALPLAGRTLAIRALDSLGPGEPAPGELVYVAVGKDAVPAVLRTLQRLERARLELLIDTPVLRFKHLRHAPLLDGWQRASVAEDTAYLPWYETVRAALGALAWVHFERAAYAYHGLAQARGLLGGERFARARRWQLDGGNHARSYEFADGRRAGVLEPRNYAEGRVIVHGASAALSDRWAPDDEQPERSPTPPPEWRRLLLEPVVEAGLCTGFRAGDTHTRLDPREAELTRGDAPGAAVTARMESMKRIGFRRLLQAVAAGRGAYPVEHGLEDMSIDWFLERFGRWRAGGLCDLRRPTARQLWSALGRLG